MLFMNDYETGSCKSNKERELKKSGQEQFSEPKIIQEFQKVLFIFVADHFGSWFLWNKSNSAINLISYPPLEGSASAQNMLLLKDSVIQKVIDSNRRQCIKSFQIQAHACPPNGRLPLLLGFQFNKSILSIF